MSFDQAFLFTLIGLVFILLVSGRVRYDLVAFGALVIAVIAGVVPKDKAFSGFGHPAVIIVALVLIVSKGLMQAGFVELITQKMASRSRTIRPHIALFGVVVASLSTVMNNVAALALMMPVDMQAAKNAKRAPGLTLMPLAFASILGGMITLIGTPPNIVVSAVRERELGTPFNMLDFAPVGLICAAAGLFYIVTIGWKFLPARLAKQNARDELGVLTEYVIELEVPAGSPVVGWKVPQLDEQSDKSDVEVLGLRRGGKRLPGYARRESLKAKDVVILYGGSEEVLGFMAALKLAPHKSKDSASLTAEGLETVSAVVASGSEIEGVSVRSFSLKRRFDTVLVGISRQGRPFHTRLLDFKTQAGDILLLMGKSEGLGGALQALGCYPLAGRANSLIQSQKAWLAGTIFGLTILLASLGLVYLPIALAACVCLFAATRVLSVRELYNTIEWPILVLLASLVPIADALQTSGGTGLIVNLIYTLTDSLPHYMIIALLLVFTMTLSDFLNNVATALIAAPIAIELAGRLGSSPDPLLMAVAVGSSCAFLTPIGHKNNMLILGPGGYRFSDYWRMGLLLEVIIVLVTVPAIMIFWGT
jgi:di/tricarboxylate transporter